jgi:hypothetical protein
MYEPPEPVGLDHEVPQQRATGCLGGGCQAGDHKHFSFFSLILFTLFIILFGDTHISFIFLVAWAKFLSRIWICKFLGLQDPDPQIFVRIRIVPDLDPVPDPCNIEQTNFKKP